MGKIGRRRFLKTSAAGMGSLVAVRGATSKEALPAKPASTGAPWPQRYGTAKGRVAFRDCWRDPTAHPFHHEDQPSYHRLRTSLDAHYSRAEQPVRLSAGEPLRLSVKLLCEAEAGRTLFTLGLKSKSHGCWAFSIGANPSWGISFTEWGWQIMVNAAKPWKERVSLAGFDNHDWHTFVLEIPNAQGPAKLYCDGQYVMDLVQPITDEQRARETADQNPVRHGSVQQLVPETPGEGDYIFLESRHPDQVIDIDRIEVSQQPRSTRRGSLPVLLDQDWELEGMRLAENTLTRYEGNPILKKTDIPDPTGKDSGGYGPKVLRDGQGFHMYFNAVTELSRAEGRADVAPYHAISTDGIHWEVTPKGPVLTPGDEDAWDAAGLTVAGVVKEQGLFRMWYGGYVRRAQQGRAGYAESKDGIHWSKPRAGLLPFAGKPSNLCFSLQSGLHSNEYELAVDVVRDDDGPPERRYILFLHTQGPHGFIVDVATSPDGRHFTHARHNARTFGFEEVPRSYSLHGSAVVLREGDYWWAFVEQDIQNQNRMRFTGWAVEPEEKENISFGLWRGQRTHLDPDPQTGEGVGLVGDVLEVGNEWWVYYNSGGNLCLAKVGRHRMYGLELLPSAATGQVTTIGWQPPRGGWRLHQLTLNASGLAGGSRIETEVVDLASNKVLEGFSFAECLPIESDGYEIPLRWGESGKHLPETAGPLRVRFRLTRGSGNPQVHAVYVRKS